METNIKFNYPSSEKVYLSGKLYPETKVGMRKVSLTPTITVEGGERRVEPNDPVYVYDTSGRGTLPPKRPTCSTLPTRA